MTATAQNNILDQYSISVLRIKFDHKTPKTSLMGNLSKYMIKWQNKKENLSTNMDEILYGK